MRFPRRFSGHSEKTAGVSEARPGPGLTYPGGIELSYCRPRRAEYYHSRCHPAALHVCQKLPKTASLILGGLARVGIFRQNPFRNLKMTKVREAIEEIIEESYLLGRSEREIRQDFKRFVDTCYAVIHDNIKDREAVSSLAWKISRGSRR